MLKRGKIKLSFTIFIFLLFFFVVFHIQIISSIEEIFSPRNTAIPSKPTTVGNGGGSIPITTIELDEQGVVYDNTKPSRMKFELNGAIYAIQLRRVKEDYAGFIIMTLDANKPNDITTYIVGDSFSLIPGEERQIDIDKDGIDDILLALNRIDSPFSLTGERVRPGIRSAGFNIKKINTR